MEFDNNILENIKFIINQYGLSICDEPKRFSSLLMDLCPANRREVNLLLTALGEGIVDEMLRNSQPIMIEAICTRLSQKLITDHGISDDAAQWAVRGWANALGFKVEVQPINNTAPTNIQTNANTYPQNQPAQYFQSGYNQPPPIINPNMNSTQNSINTVLDNIQSRIKGSNLQFQTQYKTNDAINGLNWGGFVFPLFWGLANKVKYAWISIIPYVGFIMSIIYLIYGNRMAWNSDRQWRDINEFKQVQKIWEKWALYTVICLVVIYGFVEIINYTGWMISNYNGY